MKLDPPCNRGESREEESNPAGRRRNKLRCRVATTGLGERMLDLSLTTSPKLGQSVVRQSMLWLSRASILGHDEEFRASEFSRHCFGYDRSSQPVKVQRQPIRLYVYQIVCCQTE